METLHSNTLLSSTSPAENPSTGLLQRSERHKQPNIREIRPDTKIRKEEEEERKENWDQTSELLLKKKARLGGGGHSREERAIASDWRQRDDVRVQNAKAMRAQRGRERVECEVGRALCS